MKRKFYKGTSQRPRLSVYRSNRYIYAQIIDDGTGKTLAEASEKELKQEKGNKMTKTQKAGLLGKLIAEKAKKLKIVSVIYDRGSYKFHGRVKNLATVAREAGLKI